MLIRAEEGSFHTRKILRHIPYPHRFIRVRKDIRTGGCSPPMHLLLLMMIRSGASPPFARPLLRRIHVVLPRYACLSANKAEIRGHWRQEKRITIFRMADYGSLFGLLSVHKDV